MMNNLNIRKAKTLDAKILSQLVMSLSHYYLAENETDLPNWLTDSFSEMQFLARLDSDAYSHFIAETDNAIIGFIAIKHPNHLYHLFVDENYHAQGIGKKLWEYAFEKLSLETQPEITVRASLSAVPFYQKLGFVATDAIMEKDGVQFLSMQRMSEL